VKQVKSSFKSKANIFIQQPFELIHLHLLGPTTTAFISDKRYSLLIVEDYYRCTWVKFLSLKDETFKVFRKFLKQVQNEKCVWIVTTKSDYSEEFENENFRLVYKNYGVNHNISTPKNTTTKWCCSEKEYIFTVNGSRDA